ncbi:MAG: ATP-dependent zinc protease family protein [Deltaproteobacteria bacterium]
MSGGRIIIGRKDKVDFPDLGLFDVEAKIDTGAYTSAIHCQNVEVVGSARERRVRFCLLDSSHPSYCDKTLSLPIHAERRVKNSFGESEERFIIKTRILIFDRLIEAEFSLGDRSRMEFPVLIGRKLLYNRFIVDVAEYDLSYNRKQESGK